MAQPDYERRQGDGGAELRASLTIGIAVGVPAAVGVGAFLALFRASAPPGAWRTVTAEAWGSFRSGRANRAAARA